jgi:glycosyltransferase involved in cell wall biosynthesis
LKLLLVHNNYGIHSGEESVVDKMAAMFAGHGHEVCFYRKTTEGSRESLQGQMKAFVAGVYSPSGVRGLRDILRKEKPDMVNVHNLYPFISPAALFECAKADVPVVMTVHNFRLMCPTGLFMRNGKPCELCLQHGNEWNCLRYNCENSLLKSAGYALRNAYARMSGAYAKNVSRFVCITAFQRQKLMEAGYDKDRIVVIPNSLDAPTAYEYRQGGYVAYCGRLSYEKGFDLLIEVARRHPDITFRFAGAVRENTKVDKPDNVYLDGYLNKKELNDFIASSRFVVIPSRCYEGFSMAALEAAGFGKPTIAPNHGGFPEIIGTGIDAIGRLFEPNNIVDLERKIVELWNSPDETERLGRKAFEKLQSEYDSNVVYAKWEQLIDEIKKK